jgi:hypothetical protein
VLVNKKTVVLAGALILVLGSSLPAGAGDAADIERVIKASYFNGAFNDLDTDAMRRGFHADFAIFSADGEKLGRYPIDTWIKGIEKRKEDPDYDRSKAKMDCRIVSLDVTGGAAAAKIEISREGKLVYTDYLSLLKFSDGWKIAAKVYQSHKD